MTVFVIALTSACLGLGLLLVLLPRSAARQRAVLIAASWEAGLGLTEAVEPSVLRRSRRAQRLSYIGGVLGWAGGVWLLPTVGGATTSIWLLIGGVLLGGAIGNLTAAPLDAGTSMSPSAPRVARGTSVTLSDYIAPVERTFGWVATAAIAAGAVACACAGIHQIALLVALPALVASLWLIGAVGSRFVISRPQHAASPVELAWDDALRAKNLRALMQAAPLAAIYGSLAMLGALDVHRQVGWQVAVAILALLPPVVALLLAFRQRRRGARFYLRRLWPQVAADLDHLEHSAQ